MPIWLPTPPVGRFLTSAEGIVVTASATAHVKGAWTQLIASTPQDAYGVFVMMSNVGASAVDTSMLVDIGIGAVGSESVLVPDLNAGGAHVLASFGKRLYLPLYVPRGSRLAARAQAAVASDTVRVDLFLYGDPPTPAFVGSKVTAYGVNAAASRGTSVAASNAWTEITASTADEHYLWYVMPDQLSDTTTAASNATIDIGFGPSAAETQFGHWFWRATNNEEIGGPEPPVAVYRSLPAGTRIAVRQSDTEARGAIVYAVS